MTRDRGGRRGPAVLQSRDRASDAGRLRPRAPASGFADRYDTLSAREREIFQLIAEARSNKEVAALLGISPATVETHRARILQKLDVHNIAEVVRYAVRRGIIS